MTPPPFQKKNKTFFLDETLTCHQKAGNEAILPACDLSEDSWDFSSLTLGDDRLDSVFTYRHEAGREMCDQVVFEVPCRQKYLLHLLIECNLVEERRSVVNVLIGDDVLDCVSADCANVWTVFILGVVFYQQVS